MCCGSPRFSASDWSLVVICSSQRKPACSQLKAQIRAWGALTSWHLWQGPLSLVSWQKVARPRLLQARPSVRACGKWRKATCWHYGVGLQYVFMSHFFPSHCQQHIEASTIASNLHCIHACQMISTPPKLARSALHPRCQMVSTPSQTHPPGVDSWLHPRLTNDKNTRLSASAQHRIPSYTHTRSGASAQHCTHAFFSIHSLAADLTCHFQATRSWK